MSIILINKGERGIKHCFWCKVHCISSLVVWRYVTYVTNFMAFFILLNCLNNTSNFIFISELIFVLNRHKDTCLSTIESITSN